MDDVLKPWKIKVTLLIIALTIIWFFWAYHTNLQRENPTFESFPEFRYIEHIAVGFAAPLTVYFVVYLIILPAIFSRKKKGSFFLILREDRKEKLDKFLLSYWPAALVVLGFELVFQFLIDYNSDSFFQVIITAAGFIPLKYYIRWVWK